MEPIIIHGDKKSGIFFVLVILVLVLLATLNTSNAATPLYVNGSSGDDMWDGTSPVYVSGDVGPMQTITTALKAVDDDGTVNVAEGTYNEALFIDRNLNLIGNGASNSRITAPDPSDNIITITQDSKVTISGFTIQGALSGTGINLQGGSVTLTDNNLIENQNGINIDGAKATITGNNIQDNQLGINISSGVVPEVIRINFNRITKNEIDIYTEVEGINGQYNWWGDNNDPKIKVTGVVTSPWIYMTISANPTLILNGGTSQITASFNNAYDGSTITVLDPAHGHLPDECDVTFTTDRGSVGNGNTINGTAAATFTANEGTGTAHLAAQLDTQIVNTNVGIETLYVNANTGNDAWDGTSPIYISGTTGPMKTIQTAINTINSGGTVYVATGTYYEHLNINKNLNLIGDNRDSTIVDGTSTGRSLNIGAADVDISNFTIKNGNVTGNGGGIFSLATLTINNCAITGNTATSNGGGIYAAGTTIVNNSIIAGNTATNGGGIAYGWNTMTIRYSRLTNNTATVGREIYLISGTIDAQYNWWGENSGPQTGQISGTVTYAPWLFMVFLADPTVILRGETSNLTANLNNAFDGITHTTLDPANGHLTDGCQITFSTDLGSVGSYTTIKNTLNGVATGILTADGEAGVANVSVLFDSKYITRTITINDKRYVNNATGNDTWDGSSPTHINGTKGPMKTIQTAIAAINNDGTISVAGGTYTEYIDIDKNLHLMGVDPSTTIIENTNYLGRVSGNIIVNIENFTIRNNLGGYGVIELYDSKLTLNNCIITDNWVSDQGGAIINYAGNLIITNSILSGNTAGYEGWSYSYSMGGVIFNDNGRVNITNCTFTNNTAHYGGVIYSNGGKVTIANSIFTFNKAINGEETTDGGVIYNNQGLVTIMDCTFTNNTATTGGAIYNIGKLTITNSTLTQNSATNYGGSIYIAPDSSPLNTINIFNSLLTENTASVGAILYMDFDPLTTGTVNITNSIITGNHADFGALYVSRGILNITNSTLTNNTVTSNGGVIYNSINGLVNVNDSNLSKNTARDGGALYNQGVVNITNSSLSENTATNGDGGVLMNLGTVSIIKSNLSNNIARNGGGGAVYSINGGINITDSILSCNNATIDDGGAIQISSGTLTITNSTVINNTCGNNGGAISINLATANITGSTLSGNTATYNGGAIYNEDTTINMHFNRISGNTLETITNNGGVIFAENNWWGTNSNPYSQFAGFVNYSPWLYMTFTANPTLIRNGETSQLNASFNNAYNGITVTSLDPVSGHLPDNSLVTFNTDLGSVGSKNTIKNTINGLATAILTADGEAGIANVSAQLDSQNMTNNIEIYDYRYVNGVTGNDSWDGTSPTYIGGTNGPMKTIQTAINVVAISGTVFVANGTYYEHLTINKNLNLIGTDRDTTIIDGTNNGRPLYVNAVSNVNIANFTIRNGTSVEGGGIYSLAGLTMNNLVITGNTAVSGGGIYSYGTTIMNNSVVTGNTAVSGGGVTCGANTLTIKYSRITNNTAPFGSEIHQSFGVIDARYNWWGQNTGPQSGQIYGTVNTNPWLYMIFTADSTLILNGGTSTLTVSFNNEYDGSTVNPINPANGHIPDGSPVTFTTDLGSVGSNSTTKSTVNGIAIATLTADGGTGFAHVSGSLDNQTLYYSVSITDVVYVNGDSGNDLWDGTSPVYISGTEGPKKTIQNAVKALVNGGTINVAMGTYSENLVLDRKFALLGAGIVSTILSPVNAGSNVVLVNSGGQGSTISGFNITGAGGVAAIMLNNVNDTLITNSTISGSTIGVAFNNAGNNTVSNVLLMNNGAAVQIYRSNLNMVNNCTFTSNDYGVYLLEANNNNIGNSFFTVTNGNGRALYLESGQGNQINNNTITGGVYGIESLNDYQNIYNGNNVSLTAWRNLYLTNSQKDIIINNHIHHTINGLLILGGSQNQLTGNTLDNCGSSLEIVNSNNNNISGNNITQNTFGIYLYGDLSSNITFNNVSSCGSGIELHESSQNIIKFNTFTQNTFGTYIAGGMQNTVELNTLQDTLYGGAGVHFENTSNNNINNNTFTNTVKDFRYGIYINQGSNNTINNNNASNNHAGLELHNTNINQATANNLNNNTVGLFMDNSQGNIFNTNTINGNGAGVEMHDSHLNIFNGVNVSSSTFGFIIFNGNNNTIISSVLNGNGAAINLQTSINTTIGNNQMNNNSYGVYMLNGDHNLVQNSQITDIKLDGSGVFLDNTTQNTVKQNSFINMEKLFTYGVYQTGGSSNLLESNTAIRNHAGIELHDTTSNLIKSNSLSFNTLGVFVWNGSENNFTYNIISNNGAGIEIHLATENNLIGNNLTGNVYGFYLDQLTSSNIKTNNLTSNTVGLYSDNSSSNQIFTNNFDTNDIQAYDSGTNNWDNGSDTGNCWSDYSGSGVYEIWGGSNIDHYPTILHV